MSNNKPTRQVAIVPASQQIPHRPVEQMSFFDMEGNPLSVGTPDVPDTGSTVKLTGYAPHAVGAVAAADTVNVAIAKLEARIVVLETP